MKQIFSTFHPGKIVIRVFNKQIPLFPVSMVVVCFLFLSCDYSKKTNENVGPVDIQKFKLAGRFGWPGILMASNLAQFCDAFLAAGIPLN